LAAHQTRLSHAEAAAAQAEAAFRRVVASFDRLTSEFELRAVAPTGGIYSPSVGTASAALGKVIRLRPNAAPETFVLDLELLPPSLASSASLAQRSPHKHVLFRVIRREGARWHAARWACYFEESRKRVSPSLRAKAEELGLT
jgi:hypothetical protein